MGWKWAVQAEESSRLHEQGESSVARCTIDLARTAYTEKTVHSDFKSSYSKVREPAESWSESEPRVLTNTILRRGLKCCPIVAQKQPQTIGK